jgi:hypothetical protein
MEQPRPDQTTELERIAPFPAEVKKASNDLIYDPSHQCWERLPILLWERYHVFLSDPYLKPDNATDSNHKNRALHSYELIDNCLYRKPDAKHLEPRFVVPASEVFDKIVQEHWRVGHAGQDKT